MPEFAFTEISLSFPDITATKQQGDGQALCILKEETFLVRDISWNRNYFSIVESLNIK